MHSENKFLVKKLKLLDNCIQMRKANLEEKNFSQDPELKYWYNKRAKLVKELESMNSNMDVAVGESSKDRRKDNNSNEE